MRKAHQLSLGLTGTGMDWGTIYQGKEAGTVVNQVSGFEYTMGFEALGDDWDYNELVIDVQIIPAELVVTVSPSQIYPGDTVNIVPKYRLADGTLAEYPSDQRFEVAKLDGCILEIYYQVIALAHIL